MKTRLDVLNEVEPELMRFIEKFKEAQEELEGYKNKDNSWEVPSKKFASLKRASLDLKNELSKITQDWKYRSK